MPQTFYKLYYHIIWATKKRLPLINPEIEKLIKKYVPNKITEYNGKQLALNMVEDHIHLLVSIPPKISIADFVHKIKGSSSHHINALQGGKNFYWQSGYGIVSLSEKGVPFVKQYINNQKQKHQNNDLVDILEYIQDEDGEQRETAKEIPIAQPYNGRAKNFKSR
ncbi:IS200/IS605 family transposase [Candidatus Parcubacteria bacterium]|nr:IS200/IS605 family transposase [Candidatus Parcubacteria bacterium]